jgi:hypothetical protein
VTTTETGDDESESSDDESESSDGESKTGDSESKSNDGKRETGDGERDGRECSDSESVVVWGFQSEPDQTITNINGLCADQKCIKSLAESFAFTPR